MLNRANHENYITAAGIDDKGGESEYYTNQIIAIIGHDNGIKAVAKV